MTQERVHFRLFQMPCCGHLLCWVNPRFPSFCPECGALIGRLLKTGEHHRLNDEHAVLHYNERAA